MCYKDAGDRHCTQSTQQDAHHSRQTATAEEPGAAGWAVRWGCGHSDLVTCVGFWVNISQQVHLSITLGSNFDRCIIKDPGNNVF